VQSDRDEEKSRKIRPLIRQCLDLPASTFKVCFSFLRSPSFLSGTDRAKSIGNVSRPLRQTWTIIQTDPRWYPGGIPAHSHLVTRLY
jgi:hypothetical protein